MNAVAERINQVSKPLTIWFLAGAGVVIALAYHETLFGLLSLWLFSDTVDYSHGFLLLALSVGLAVYKLWKNPDLFRLRPTYYGMVLMVLAALVWGVSALLFIEVGARLSLWMLFIALVLALFGWEGIRHLWLPLLLPLFGIPVWSIFNEILRLGTAHVVDGVLEVIGVTTLLEGSTITLTMGKFYIADNCTGIRQLVVAMPLALLFASWNRLRLVPSIAVFLAAVMLSFILNVLRILIVVVSGVLTNMQHYFVTEDHVALGWALFGVGMFLFFYGVSRALPNRWTQTEKQELQSGNPSPTESRRLIPFLAVFLLVLLVPASVSWLFQAPVQAGTRTVSLPSELGGWKASASKTEKELHGVYKGADEVTRRSYADKYNIPVHVEIALYRFQERGREVVGWGNSPFNDENWRLLKENIVQVHEGDAITPVRELTVVSATGNRRLIWTWYRIADQDSASSIGAKLLGIRGLLCGRSDASMIVITHDATLTLERASASMKRFLVETKEDLTQRVNLAVSQDTSAPGCS